MISLKDVILAREAHAQELNADRSDAWLRASASFVSPRHQNCCLAKAGWGNIVRQREALQPAAQKYISVLGLFAGLQDDSSWCAFVFLLPGRRHKYLLADLCERASHFVLWEKSDRSARPDRSKKTKTLQLNRLTACPCLVFSKASRKLSSPDRSFSRGSLPGTLYEKAAQVLCASTHIQ